MLMNTYELARAFFSYFHYQIYTLAA